MKKCLPTLLWYSLLALPGLAQHSDTELLQQYRKTLPFEKLYLHTDQSVYEPGSIIWFGAYLVDEQNQRITDWIRVQLLDPQGQVVQDVYFDTKPGEQSGCIEIKSTWSGGVYTLRAASQWAFNFGRDNFFEKKLLVQKTVLPRLRLKLELDRSKYQAAERVVAQVEVLNNDNRAVSNLSLQANPVLGNTSLPPITVQTNAAGKASFSFQLPDQIPPTDGLLQVKMIYDGQAESIARSIPLRQEQVKLWLFPEGGDLVADFKQQVAFKMLDTLGNSVDGRGTLYNSQHQALLRFESFHKGMGSFTFTPQSSERYYARLDGQKDTFYLPKVREDELALALGLASKDSLPLVVWKRNPGPAHLLLRFKDSIVWQQKLQLAAGNTALKLPIESLPIGVAQVIVEDEQQQPFAERLVFLNPHRQAYLRIKTQKEDYLPLGEVKIDIEAKDETGKPLDGIFSLAVVDDLHWTNADDKQDNILSRLLLSAELRGKIDEPFFYFKPNEPKAALALDLVMLTHGWRKFSWKEVLAFSPQDAASIVLYSRKNFIAGQFKHYYDSQRKLQGKVWFKGQTNKIKTDSVGRFKIPLPKDEIQYPLELIGRSKDKWATHSIWQPIIPPIEWPQAPKRILQSVNTDKLVQPKPRESVSMVLALDDPALRIRGISSLDFDGPVLTSSQLEEVVVTSTGISRQLSGLAAGLVNSIWGDGIGDNLEINTGRFWGYNGFNLHVDETMESRYRNSSQYMYTRIFADFPTLSTSDQLRRDYTIYWNSQVAIRQGKGCVQFKHSNKTGTFRIVVEGVAQQALVGRAEATYAVQKLFELSTQVPEIVLDGDTLVLEVRLKNRGDTDALSTLKMLYNGSLDCLNENLLLGQKIKIPAYSTTIIQVPCVVRRVAGKSSVQFRWDDGVKMDERWSQAINVKLRGFQHEIAHSGGDEQTVFQFPITKFLPGTLDAHFYAYSTLYQEMLEGLASIIREPHGCFEQVSSSNYPSIMALQVLKETGQIDFDFQKKAIGHLENGYKLLVGYEVPGGGFSIFGKAPASERLTAYGLLQFWDLRTVFSGVNMQMFEKNLDWLMSRKKTLLDDPLSHLFTLYALSEIRPALLQGDLSEFETKQQKRLERDPYLTAILLSAYANLKDSSNIARLQAKLKALIDAQKPGLFQVNSTFGLSYGKNVQTETAAWALLALCKANQQQTIQVKHLLDFLRKSRDAHGGFGSTQATVIALKAIQAFHQTIEKTQVPGEIRVRINDTWVDTLFYSRLDLEKLKLACSKWLRIGSNEVEIIQASNQKPIPFVFEARWADAEIPQDKATNPLQLKIEYSNHAVKAGDFVRIAVALKNHASRAVNAPMVVLGIPAGLGLQNWQLLEMEKKHLFDHFELRDNYLVLYFESMEELGERSFHFDLKANQAGHFQSPLSVAYPYYDAEQKSWFSSQAIHISSTTN
jgi:alpha-2-macroglobulin-like protein